MKRKKLSKNRPIKRRRLLRGKNAKQSPSNSSSSNSIVIPETSDYISQLPRELISHVFSFLSLRHIIDFHLTSKKWNQTAFSYVTSINCYPYRKRIPDEFFENHDLTPIKSLNLTGCFAISDNGLKSLSKLTNLNELIIVSCCRITDRTIQYISNLTNLKTLNLSDCEITDDGIGILFNFSCLEFLDLSWSKISDNGIRQISRLDRLKRLSLSQCEITDVGLGFFSGLKNLRELDLSRNRRITDEGIKLLCRLTNLGDLNLKHCKNVTQSYENFLK
eukprot:TRINITY_DN2818_c0_g1_i2.p1 TRINITY_DN2818_c0_g1~~TRINITY_DN2818_c0_g1_i2.p1  ORF type:complete len:276 (+),score=36.97 TRINITY_DN2818_c0_g1_i2:43-870(+)